MQPIRNIIYIAIALGLYRALKHYYGKRDGTISDMPNRAFMWTTLVFAIGLIFGTPYFGTKVPGSFFERDEYREMFYVNLFPDEQRVKSYRVPASILVYLEGGYDYDNDPVYWRAYKIQFAIMPNGGKVTFGFSDDYVPLELGSTVTVYDDDERPWGVELTDKPASK